MKTPDEVLEFWFGAPATTGDELMAKVRRWFAGGEAMDREVNERFGETVHAAVEGKLDSWASTPRGRLALVILLDQLTRNTFRNQARMYDGDARAQVLALDGFSDGTAEQLSHLERLFLSMPLLHSENLAHHRRAAELAKEIWRDAPSFASPLLGMHEEQVAKYARIIERFGRFPHRNAILGRTSTGDEVEFLQDWAEKQPPAAARTQS